MSKLIPLPNFVKKAEKIKMTKRRDRKTKPLTSSAPPTPEILEKAPERTFDKITVIGKFIKLKNKDFET